MVESAENILPDLTDCRLLVVDDDPAVMGALKRVLRGLGATVTAVGSLREARITLETQIPDAAIVDLVLKDGSGLDLLHHLQHVNPQGLFYLVTGHGSVANAVAALKQGVLDYFEKPADPLMLARRLDQDLGLIKSQTELAEDLSDYLLFHDKAMVEALMELPYFARSHEAVLIQGETGTGKELVARAIHGIGPRSQEPFIAVNCGAIPDNLLEAELFGYEKGAFTGAQRRYRGRFEQAHKGTLFLDEIGEMPALAQVSLLRVLEEKLVQRIGGEDTVRVDVRVIAATHQDLRERVNAGLFREDLFYRLNVLPIHLPPLRDRPSDIPLLARHFLTKSLADMARQNNPPRFSQAALRQLQQQSWPGNVRELRNLMTRLAVRLSSSVGEIGAPLLDTVLPSPSLAGMDRDGIFIPAGTSLKEAEWLLIDAALKKANFNRSHAAKLLGIGERTLRRKLNAG